MGWRGEGRMVLESLEGSLLVFGHEFALLLLLVPLRAALAVLAPFSSTVIKFRVTLYSKQSFG